MVAAQGFEGGAFVSPQFVDELLAALREAGKKILSRAEKLAEKHGKPVQPLLVETLGQGVAHEVLIQARKLRAELIVLGTHGRRGLSRLVMGSDAEAILREARVPVLLVRSPATRAHRGTGSPTEVPRRAAPPRAKKSAAASRRPVRRPGSQ
jgi:nucleotide-binding universal stress UspA family protein